MIFENIKIYHSSYQTRQTNKIMFLKLFQGQGQGKYLMQFFAKRIHTQVCLNTLFEQRRKVENEWKDDEDEQKRAFREEEKRIIQEKKQQQLKCEITGKTKHTGSVDCTCEGMCMARKSETYLIHYEGGTGIIPNN